MPRGPAIPSSLIIDFYPTSEAFEEDLNLCEEIAEETDDRYLLDLVQSLQANWGKFGIRAYLTEKQYEFLKETIANHKAA